MAAMRRRFRVLSAGCSLALAAPLLLAPARLSAQEPYPGLERYVDAAIRTWKVPGLAIAIVRNDSVIYAKGFGVQAVGASAAVDDRTLFEIGSSSKAFTATLVAMLVSDGRMQYDQKLADLLPGFRLADPVANAEVTVRDALTHRAGLSRAELAWLGAGVSREEVLHRLRFLKPESPFRSKWSYQNMMYLAAGEAAAKAAGDSWDHLVAQRIFAPLGMTSTFTSVPAEARNVATPHGLIGDSVYTKPHMDISDVAPAGAIVSNARDMAQWLRFQLNDGTVSGKRLVSHVALAETHAPQILMAPGVNPRTVSDTAPATTLFSAYGMGWMIEDYHHQLMWQHGGNTDGMTTAVGMLPERKFGVAVLSNMNGAQLPALLMHYIFDRQLGLPMQDVSAEAFARYAVQRKRADSLEAAQKRPERAEPPVPLSAYVGTYADSLYGEAKVTLSNGQLQLERGAWHGPLEYWNGGNFRWTILPSAPTPPLFIKFDTSPQGTVTGMYFGLGSDVTLMGRKPATSGFRVRPNP
jgi:CubicO group peptidase (beta-lactamase class C family)